ncbi:hypothetical protein PRUPE_1G166900 [Prunus persica]|uniref:Uncharacterized protein n=1 Tax=Prunus persica TaxID=3760 RepID=A0A251QYR4_PRUPE|nr:hypothetical protein PRUPE_1G166900 [Prunus persica]
MGNYSADTTCLFRTQTTQSFEGFHIKHHPLFDHFFNEPQSFTYPFSLHIAVDQGIIARSNIRDTIFYHH